MAELQRGGDDRAHMPCPRRPGDDGLLLLRLVSTGDAPSELIARALAESLVHHLTTFRDLRVVGPTAMSTSDLRVMGSRFGVRFVLQGAVIARTSKVRLNSRLVDAHSGRRVWSAAETLDGSAFVAFDVEDRWAKEVSARIADATGALHRYELSERGRSTTSPSHTARLSYYGFLENASWRASATAALALDRAIGGGDRSADLLAMRAWVHTSDVIHGISTRPGDDLRAAESLAREALSADPRCAEAVIALGDVAALRGQHAVAVLCAEQAVELAPGHPTVLMAAASLHRACGGGARGAELVRESYRLSPGHRDGGVRWTSDQLDPLRRCVGPDLDTLS